MPNYSAIDLNARQMVHVRAVVHIVEQSDTLKPGTSDTNADLKALQEADWSVLAAISSYKVSPQTEDDAVGYTDPVTHQWVDDPQTIVNRRTITLNAADSTPLLDAIQKGVPNPTSAAAKAQLSAGSTDGAPLFASSNPNVGVGVRITSYNAAGDLLQTMYFYANIKATGEQEYNGKTTVKPVITMEIQPSPFNRYFNEAAMTLQKETMETTE